MKKHLFCYIFAHLSHSVRTHKIKWPSQNSGVNLIEILKQPIHAPKLSNVAEFQRTILQIRVSQNFSAFYLPVMSNACSRCHQEWQNHFLFLGGLLLFDIG